MIHRRNRSLLVVLLAVGCTADAPPSAQPEPSSVGAIVVEEDRPATAAELDEIAASQLFDTVLTGDVGEPDDDIAADDIDEAEPADGATEEPALGIAAPASLPLNTVRKISFIDGPAICKADLTATVFSTFGAAVNVKLTSGPCTNSTIVNYGDQYNASWSVPTKKTKTGTGLNQWFSAKLDPATNHQASVTLCINDFIHLPRCSTPYVVAINHAASGYVFTGKGQCQCKNGTTVTVSGTATGAKHCHDCCTRAKKAATAKCTSACSGKGGVKGTLQSHSPCQVRKK